MLDADAIGRNWRAARERVAACAGGRAVTVVAVAKTMPAAAVRAAAAAGARDVGENYLQEAEGKIADCADLPLAWHFVGHVQGRKARRVAALFDWVHGVDNVACARKLSAGREAVTAARGALNVFLQVNVSGEASKAGFAGDDAAALADAVAEVSGMRFLRLRGLMALPAPAADAGAQAAVFGRVADLQRDVAARAGVALDCLSMGMSGDFEAAIAAGATHVRLGTTVFGARSGKSSALDVV